MTQEQETKDVWDLYFEENPIESVFEVPDQHFAVGYDKKALAGKLDRYEDQWDCCCKIIYCEIDRKYYMVKE